MHVKLDVHETEARAGTWLEEGPDGSVADQAVPLRVRMTSCPFVLSPIATQETVEVHEIPLTWFTPAPAGEGMAFEVHTAALSVAVRPRACMPQPAVPTAMHQTVETHETPDSATGTGPDPNELVGVQVAPDRVSMNPLLCVSTPTPLIPLDGPDRPTATHAVAELHETASSSAEVLVDHPDGIGGAA